MGRVCVCGYETYSLNITESPESFHLSYECQRHRKYSKMMSFDREAEQKGIQKLNEDNASPQMRSFSFGAPCIGTYISNQPQ